MQCGGFITTSNIPPSSDFAYGQVAPRITDDIDHPSKQINKFKYLLYVLLNSLLESFVGQCVNDIFL